MPNDIFQRQNEPRFIRMLAAQRQLYREGKRWNTLILFLTTVSAVSLPIIYKFAPDSGTAFEILAGGASLIVALVLQQIPKNKAAKAAKIQELFDCGLYGIETNRASETALGEIIAEKEQKISRREKEEKLTSWYSNYSQMEKSEAIIRCQRENLYWDSRLKVAYANLLTVVTIIIFFLGIAWAYINSWDVLQWASKVLVPQLGLLVYLILILWNNRKVAGELNFKLQNANDLYDQYHQSGGSVPEAQIKKIQTAIFEKRQFGELTPDWFYEWKRKAYQKTVTDTANQIKSRPTNS